MNVQAYLAHTSHGRMRIKVPALRNDSEYFQHAADSIAGIMEVIEVRTNPRSASILILHEGLALDNLRQHTLDEGLFELQASDTESNLGSQDSMKAIGMQALTIGGNYSRSMFFYLLMVMAIRQAMKGQLMAPAVSLFWYAFELLEMSRRK